MFQIIMVPYFSLSLSVSLSLIRYVQLLDRMDLDSICRTNKIITTINKQSASNLILKVPEPMSGKVCVCVGGGGGGGHITHYTPHTPPPTYPPHRMRLLYFHVLMYL